MTHCARLVVTLSFLAAVPHICRAEFIFLGPTPYKSAADSPFPVDGSNPNFFLEDFEDGALNTPGITIFPNVATMVNIPSSKTDSVDADDGTIDGFGIGGSSLRTIMGPDFSLPPIYSGGIRFDFAPAFGRVSNAFGIVWTDSPVPTTVNLIAFDQNDNASADNYFGLGDSSTNGETDEDRFVGVVSSVPLARIVVQAHFQSSSEVLIIPHPILEFDHVQYGFLEIPEPSGSTSILGLIAFNCCSRFRLGRAVSAVRPKEGRTHAIRIRAQTHQFEQQALTF